jgi:hypothetical protein
MEPHYILKSYKDKQGLQVLQLVYFNKGRQVRLNSGVKVREQDFDSKSQRILATIKQIGKDPVTLNDALVELKEKVNKIVREYRYQHRDETSFDIPPSTDYVKYKFFEKAPKHENDFDVLRNYTVWLANKRKKIRDDRGYVTLYNDLKEFIGKRPVTFKDINTEFLEGFLEFLLKRDIVNDTVKKKFKYLKTFLKGVGKINRYKEYVDFDLSHLQGNKETENIYTLTDPEYELMKTFEVPDEKLMYARDLFLLGCNTSLRFSDIFQLNRSNAQDIIDLTTQKTDKNVKIPVTSLTKQLLEKYNYNLVRHFRKPQRNSKGKRENGLINRYLHEYMFYLNNHCIKQGITTLNEPTLYVYRKGMERFKEYYPKWKLITFHSSKKFFFTRCLKSGIDIGGLKELTGNVEVIWRYLYGGNKFKIKDIF